MAASKWANCPLPSNCATSATYYTQKARRAPYALNASIAAAATRQKRGSALPSVVRCGVEPDLIRRIDAAARYEDDYFEALVASGLEAAKREVEMLAGTLYQNLFEVREHPPRTITGVLITARALAAFEEARPNSTFRGEGIGGCILGRGLADSVLRIAGETA